MLKTAAFKWLGVLRVIAGLALLSLVFLVTPSRADVPALRLDPKLSFSERNFGGHLQAFHDPTGQLTQQQVASPPYAQQFEPIEDGFNGGYSSGAWWLRFQIQATQEEAAHPLKGGWWLRLGARYADYLDVWLPGEGADGATALVHRELGGMRAGSARELPWSLPAVRLPELPDAQPRWVWVRLAGDRALSLIGGVSPLRELAAVQQQITAAGAAVVGMVLLMAMVSLMMGMALPDRRFIGYAGYLLTLALLFATSENLQASLWFQDSPVAAVRLHSFSLCLHSAAAFAFARSLLDMARQFPRMDRVFKALAFACGLACVMAVAGWYGRIAVALNVLWVLFAVCVVALCAVLLRRNRHAWPTLVGYSVYLLTGVMHFAKNLQWLPFTLATQYSYAMAAIAHVLAFFFAMGWRVRHRERKALALSRRHGARLEQRVHERTRDLRQEVTDHQRTHEQLTLALREQKGLLAMVSHEFRTPLGTIGGVAQMLSDERLGLAREEVKSEAEKITRTVLRMRDLVDTLLADEWLEASSEKMSPVPIELADFLGEKIGEHNEGNARGRISLALDAPELPVLADETLLHIAVDNLLTNAVKYAPAQSQVFVRAGFRQDLRDTTGHAGATSCVRIQVCDQGPGFRPQDLPHVFERFYRAEGVRRLPGIGLGLHMVRRIARLHAGSVTAANRPEGGAVLTLTLPRLASDDPQAREDGDPAVNSDQRGFGWQA
ncbi:Signal transduction histidine kinase [Variovorax sp. OK202]|nr:Signal transduction histidine kinase [Variovorax sp. OK202]